MDSSEKASMRVNCVQLGCKWAVWYLCPGFSITGEEKKGGHNKMGKARQMSEIRVHCSYEKASAHHKTWGE